AGFVICTSRGCHPAADFLTSGCCFPQGEILFSAGPVSPIPAENTIRPCGSQQAALRKTTAGRKVVSSFS
ncbi:MAG: hypothetical protein LIP06_16555, partial [Tannerellaceae bacterium]|nr:hypothetical protein [Tannerellaceae bacterium]